MRPARGDEDDGIAMGVFRDERLKGRGGRALTGLGLGLRSVARLGVLARETRGVEEDETLSWIDEALNELNFCNCVEGVSEREPDSAPRPVRIVD